MTDDQLEAAMNVSIDAPPPRMKEIEVNGFPLLTSPNLSPKEEAKLVRAARKHLFKFGVEAHWHGWSRCLWLAVQIDLRCRRVSVVLFGLHLSVGYHLRNLPFMTTSSKVDP